MSFPKKKVYGQSQMQRCPICGDNALFKNKQGIPVCKDHQTYDIELKCSCGSWLDPKQSKYGTFFVCINCGAISWNKAMNMNGIE